MLLEKKARNTANYIHLNYKRKEQNNTKQWIRQRIKPYCANKQKNTKLWIQKRKKNDFRKRKLKK